MKTTFALAFLLALSSSKSFASDTSFTCVASTGESALIEYDNGSLSMTVKGTGDVEGLTADRHEFPSLAPFLQKDDGALVSLTHVAEMTSYFESKADEASTVRQDLFQFVRVKVSAATETESQVEWSIDSFGVSKDFKIVCDEISEWHTEHEATVL